MFLLVVSGVGGMGMKFVRHAALTVAMGFATVEGACAMTDAPSEIPCSVHGAAKLDPASGTDLSLCETVRAVLSDAQGVQSVSITIISPSRASAVVTLDDGSQLPEVHVASSDSVLKASSFAMLANGLSAQLKSQAGK